MAMLRGYLIDAAYEWMIDHGFTPYMLVDTEYDGVVVPEEYIDDDGKILLNMSSDAITDYSCNDDSIEFNATFDSIPMTVSIPFESVLELYAGETAQGLYAREFGYGITVNEGESDDDVNPPNQNSKSAPKGNGGLHLV
ncbi:MAG: ClpXP protease specificity-enhancing factor SspB [Francisellaceae bacterium]